MDPHDLLTEYLRGPAMLEQALADVADDRLDATPISDRWSIRQVVCHLADAEIIYAERIKRVLCEENPTLFDWSPDLSVRPEFCRNRSPQTELRLISSVRAHIESLLAAQDVEVWQRTAVHSTDGPLTLETLMERITEHLPHHVRFIEEKKAAMDAA